MNNEEMNHPEIEFEREDLSAGGILAFLVGLGITGLVIHVVLAGMYRYLDVYEKTHQAAPSPMARPASADMRQPTPQDANKFPLPRLEVNERAEIYGTRFKEEELLNTYGWVDQKAGVAHIPIDRAMDLIAQQGLPTAPTGTAVRPGAAPKGQPRQGVRELKPTPTTTK
jgi:hypothetical protein